MLAGCSLPEQEASFDARDPNARSRAALQAMERGDHRAIPALITMLESGDPALRLIAANSLERITGKRFGYDPTAPASEREASIKRWVDWWEDQGAGAMGGRND